MGKLPSYIKIVLGIICYICSFSIGSFGNSSDTLSEIRTSVIDTALYYDFVKELTGHNDGYYVEQFIKSAGLNPKGQYPWCAAYITYVFKVNGLNVPQYPARARAWFNGDKLIGFDKVQPGDLGSLYYPNLDGGRIGHIFMYLTPHDNGTMYVKTIEGNTNDKGSREGQGVYRKIRLRSTVYNASNHIPVELEIKVNYINAEDLPDEEKSCRCSF